MTDLKWYRENMSPESYRNRIILEKSNILFAFSVAIYAAYYHILSRIDDFDRGVSDDDFHYA